MPDLMPERTSAVPTFARLLIGLVLGYLLGALLGWGLVQMLSGNRHDKALEAAMTGAFVAGPIGALIGVLVGWFRRR